MNPPATRWQTKRRSAEAVLNYVIIAFGFFILFGGVYVSTLVLLSSNRLIVRTGVH